MAMRRMTALGLLLLLALPAPPTRAGSSLPEPAEAAPEAASPWREAGLSERQAAAFALDRLAYGGRPGEVERVVEQGLAQWLERQLAADLSESEALRTRLAGLPALSMSAAEIAAKYPGPGVVRYLAMQAGVVPRQPGEAAADPQIEREQRRTIERWAREQGFLPQRDLLAQLMAQKLWRAAGSENQLAERLTDFWFNHFNVSITDNEARPFVLAYERDAIRPHLFASFRELLGATAKHPAMLAYLDNYRSVANPGQPTTVERELSRAERGGPRGGGSMGRGGRGGRGAAGDFGRRLEAERRRQANNPNRPQGLNENYARELLELHTLGVDGGYSQQDVVEVARALTGWTLLFPGRRGRERAERGLALARRAGGLGYVRQGEFVFRADAHDAGAKVVLGRKLPAGRGLEDGEEVLDLLAAHPATARHLARKLAAHFVADEPSPALVERLAREFGAGGGDLRRTMRALVEAPEFWAAAKRREKVKSPLELAISAVRALGGDVVDPRETLAWVARMGQPIFAYQTPTGFPDRAEQWVNSGALLNRMNFGLELAAGRVAGVRFDLAAMTAEGEPESLPAALATYCALLLPERDGGDTVATLAPLLADPEFASKVAERADAGDTAGGATPPGEMAMLFGFEAPPEAMAADGPRRDPFGVGRLRRQGATEPPTPLASVAGLVLGSPEFQRR